MAFNLHDAFTPERDAIGAIGAELAKAKQLQAEVPEHIGMFTVKTANRTIQEAALRPNPNTLWMTLWYEGEVCCLFSDSNLGKSIYATQIAASITATSWRSCAASLILILSKAPSSNG